MQIKAIGTFTIYLFLCIIYYRSIIVPVLKALRYLFVTYLHKRVRFLYRITIGFYLPVLKNEALPGIHTACPIFINRVIQIWHKTILLLKA